MHEGGGNCIKYLKRGWNRNEGRGNKDFKKRGGKLGHGVSALKRGERGGLEPPYKLWYILEVIFLIITFEYLFVSK